MHRWRQAEMLELEIQASSERALFEDAFAGIRELLGNGREEPTESRRVRLQARDRQSLILQWMTELAFLAEDGLLPERLGSLQVGDVGLEALVEGSPGQPPDVVARAKFRGAGVAREDATWLAKVVLEN